MKFLDFWRQEADRFQAIICDIDGTMLRGHTPMPGAIELIQEMEAKGKPLIYLTNDSSRTRDEKCELLRVAGLPAQPEQIIGCLDCLEEQAQKYNWTNKTFFGAGTAQGVKEVSCLKFEFDPSRIDTCVGVMMTGGLYDWQATWNASMNFYRRHPERRIMVIPNPDGHWPSPVSGEMGIGAGCHGRCLQLIMKELGIFIDPIYLGKPYAPIYEYTFNWVSKLIGTKVEPKRILALGDSLVSDIKGGNRAGCTTALVMTGITTPTMLKMARDDSRPQYVFDTIG